MFENIDDNLYHSPSDIYIERLEKNLSRFMEEKTGSISRAGKDILIILEQGELGDILSELKADPEISFDVLRNLKIIWQGGKSYLLCELMAVEYGHFIILKTGFSGEASLGNILDIMRQHYSITEVLYPREDPGKVVYNLEVPGTMIAGCSSIDIRLGLEDDIIETAFIDRSPSKSLGRDFFRELEIGQLISYMGRFDYNAGIFGELAFCLGIEGLLQLDIPRRAEFLRIIMSELYRITSHLDFFSRMAEVLGNDTAANMAMIERESLLGIIEVATGARVIPNFIRIGGVSYRVGSDIIKRIKRTLEVFLKGFKKIEKILLSDFALVEGLKNLGIIDRELAGRAGLSGPNLRASGPRYDLRKEHGYGIYRDIHFTIPYARGGSCLDRLNVRIGEIYQSLRIIRQAAEKIPAGPVIKSINLAHLDFDPTPFTSSVECPHGIFKIYGEIEGNRLNSFAVLGPSVPALSIVPSLLKGNSLDDMEVVMNSLDISGGEVMDYV